MDLFKMFPMILYPNYQTPNSGLTVSTTSQLFITDYNFKILKLWYEIGKNAGIPQQGF